MQETSSFVLVFGNTPVIRVLDFLIDNQEFDYSLTDIAKGSEVGWTTLHQFWKQFIKFGIVNHTRNIGRAELYKLNINNEIVKKIVEIDKIVSHNLVKKEIKNQKMLV